MKQKKLADGASLSSYIDSGVDLANRTMFLVGEINSETAYRTMVSLYVLDQTPAPIHMVLSSSGGGESEGYSVFDAIKLARSPVIITGVGAVESIATLIMQAGDLRRLSPECRVMVHNGSIDLSPGLDTDTLIAIGKEIQRNNDRYHAILAGRTGVAIKNMRKMCQDETYFSAEEAVKIKLADEVVLYSTKNLKK